MTARALREKPGAPNTLRSRRSPGARPRGQWGRAIASARRRCTSSRRPAAEGVEDHSIPLIVPADDSATNRDAKTVPSLGDISLSVSGDIEVVTDADAPVQVTRHADQYSATGARRWPGKRGRHRHAARCLAAAEARSIRQARADASHHGGRRRQRAQPVGCLAPGGSAPGTRWLGTCCTGARRNKVVHRRRHHHIIAPPAAYVLFVSPACSGIPIERARSNRTGSAASRTRVPPHARGSRPRPRRQPRIARDRRATATRDRTVATAQPRLKHKRRVSYPRGS